jgi:hypothetical protein
MAMALAALSFIQNGDRRKSDPGIFANVPLPAQPSPEADVTAGSDTGSPAIKQVACAAF